MRLSSDGFSAFTIQAMVVLFRIARKRIINIHPQTNFIFKELIRTDL